MNELRQRAIEDIRADWTEAEEASYRDWIESTPEAIRPDPMELENLYWQAMAERSQKDCTELRKERGAALEQAVESAESRQHKYAFSNEPDVCACGLPRTDKLHISRM
jgi:hypothetical protein